MSWNSWNRNDLETSPPLFGKGSEKWKQIGKKYKNRPEVFGFFVSASITYFASLFIFSPNILPFTSFLGGFAKIGIGTIYIFISIALTFFLNLARIGKRIGKIKFDPRYLSGALSGFEAASVFWLVSQAANPNWSFGKTEGSIFLPLIFLAVSALKIDKIDSNPKASIEAKKNADRFLTLFYWIIVVAFLL